MKGMQLSLLETVKPYFLENRSFEPGEWLQGQTPKGRTAAGQFAGLFDGLVKLTNGKAITPESVQRFDLTNIGDRLQILKHRFDSRKTQAEEQQARHTPEHRSDRGDRCHVVTSPQSSVPPPLPPSPPHRRSPKGQASGWIEERQGNRKRKTPSTSYYYGWQNKEGKYKRYIPAAKVHRVQQMIAERQTVAQILSFLDPNP